jgi:FtsH-binding integral membrane protein
MTDFNRSIPRTTLPAGADMATDAGLRSFMIGVYNKVALGLVLSGAIAWVTASVPAIRDLLFVVDGAGRLAGMTVLGMIVAFAPVVILLGAAFAMRQASPRSSGLLYWSIVSLIGASLGVLVLRYTGQSIATTFFVTAASFGALSLFGYTTKRDLGPIGSFLIVGVFGLIIASIVNIFVRSNAMAFVISAAGVLVFAGLIAYDTQRLKAAYYELGADQAARGVATNFGALTLYINFINLFQFLLQFMGQRR